MSLAFVFQHGKREREKGREEERIEEGGGGQRNNKKSLSFVSVIKLLTKSFAQICQQVAQICE